MVAIKFESVNSGDVRNSIFSTQRSFLVIWNNYVIITYITYFDNAYMEIFKKERVYPTQKPLDQTVRDFSNALTNQGWRVQSNVTGDKGVLQAQKSGFLRDIISANRAITFVFTSEPDQLRVNVGVGKILQNLGVTALEVLLLSEIFIFIDIPEIAWTDHVEKELLAELQNVIQN